MKTIRDSVKLNLKWNCRVCLEQSENMVSIFETESKDDCQILANIIADCAGVEIDRSNEEYPDKICPKCLNCLNVAQKFRTCCRNTDNLLKSLLYDSKVIVLTDQKTNEDSITPNEIIQTEVHEQDDDIQNCVKVEAAEQQEENNSDIFFEDMAKFYELEQDAKENTDIPVKKEIHKKLESKQNKKTKPQRKATILSINGLEQEMDVDDDDDDDDDDDGDNYNDKQDNNNSEEEYIDDENDLDYVPPIGYDNNDIERDNDNSNGKDYKGPIKKKFKVLVKSLSSLTSPPNKSSNAISKIPKKRSIKKEISIDIDGTPVLQVKSEIPSVFMCEICGNKYKKKSLLESHVRWHNAKKEHVCEVCGRAFTVNSQLTRHMRVHTGDRPYACKFCDRRFGDYSTCIKHQRTHTGERPFKCDICGKAFMYSNVLKVHLTTHTGEKPFACDKCGKKFAQKHHLKAHMETISYQNSSCRSSSN